jgi:cytochrome P450
MCLQAAKTTGTSGGKWNPGQWLSEDRTHATMNDDINHMPFGTGPQRCPGRNIATTGMIAKLALLARYVTQDVWSPLTTTPPCHLLLGWGGVWV